MLSIVACQGIPPKNHKSDTRRTKAEKARTIRVKHICHDLQRIAKQETEFSKSIINDIIPVRIEWNEAAMPFTIKKKETSRVVEVDFDFDDDEFPSL